MLITLIGLNEPWDWLSPLITHGKYRCGLPFEKSPNNARRLKLWDTLLY